MRRVYILPSGITYTYYKTSRISRFYNIFLSYLVPILPSYLAQIKPHHEPELILVYNCTPTTSHNFDNSISSFTQKEPTRLKKPQISQSYDPCILMLNESVPSNASNTTNIRMSVSSSICNNNELFIFFLYY